MTPAARAPRGRHSPVAFLTSPLGIVSSTVMLDLIGFGMVIPLLPLYAKRFDASPIQIGFLTAAAPTQSLFS